MVANIANINEIISAYMEHAYTESRNTGIQVAGTQYRPARPTGTQIWTGLKNFVTSGLQ